MVKITNGVNVFEVSSGAFEGIYKHQGYEKVNAAAVVEPEEHKEPEKTEDEIFVETVIEKPIAQWNKEEVKRFAVIKEIDLAGTKSADEAKALIKEFIDAQAQE